MRQPTLSLVQHLRQWCPCRL